MQPSADDALATDRLADFIGRKHAILQQIHALSEQQPGLIREGEMTRLMNVLSAKERLLAQLRSVERELDPFRDQDPEQRVWRRPEDRRRCQEVAADSERLLQEIMEIEKRSEQSLAERRDRAAKRLHQAHSGNEVRAAYTRAAPVSGSRLDLTSES